MSAYSRCKAVKMVPHRTIGRLTLYWRILRDLGVDSEGYIFSHYIAAKARVTPAQVRRDLMVLGYTGTPAHGYHIRKLREHIEAFIYPSSEQRAAIAGVGNIGRALLKFFSGRRPNLKIVASFEANPEKFDRLIHGCACHSIDNAESIIREQCITVGIIAVPENEAQFVADVFMRAGIRGILNFARTPLHVPPGVYVEDIDLAMSMDRVSYFSRQLLKSDELAPTAKADKENNE
jgi:redox-sensing transcriptional repressor